MTVQVMTEVEIDLDVVEHKLSPLQLMDIFTAGVNKLADGDVTPQQRRAFAEAFRRGLCENAKQMLAEAFAAEFIHQTLNVPEFP